MEATHTTVTNEVAALLEAVRRWAGGRPPMSIAGLNATVFHELACRNRLAALMHVAIDDAEHPGWDRTYQANLVHTYRNMGAIDGFLRALSQADIPCVCLRGPFFGLGLYGDPGLRPFADVDLLVPAARRRAALEMAQRHGYRLTGTMPARFFERHHLHWRLEHENGGVCELHWAVDHPYSLRRVDYDSIFRNAIRRNADGFSWMEPSPEHQLILTSMHIHKHCRVSAAATVEGDFAMRCVREGWVHHWLDVALQLQQGGERFDWNRVMTVSRQWGADEALLLGVRGARQLTGDAAPAPEAAACAKLEAELTAQPARFDGRLPLVFDRATAAGRFRAICMVDAWRYLFPPAGYFAPRTGLRLWASRAGHMLTASGRFASLAMELLWNHVVTRRRGEVSHRVSLLAFLLLAAAAQAHDFGDDVGDAATNARALSAGTPSAGQIEIDVDEDWFSFQASSMKQYTVTVTNATLWDSVLDVRGWDGVTVREQTNAYGSVATPVSFVHVGPPATYYIRLTGFAQFTTGTYSVVIGESPFTDVDGDGMPDAWEQGWFGGTSPAAGADADGDGASNLTEFRAGTSPTDAGSVLLARPGGYQQGGASVLFEAQAFHCYRLDVATNIVTPVWTPVATLSNLQSSAPAILIDTNAASRRMLYYRIRGLY